MRNHQISGEGTGGLDAAAGGMREVVPPGQDSVPAPGEGMVAELKWVHGMIRRDLEIVRRLADELGDGLPGESAAATIADLAVGSPLWQLKINCLQYCRFVHMHHHGESALLFPQLRRSNPALGPVVDKLEADHGRVSDLLDDVSAAAVALAGEESDSGRKQLIAALEVLSEELLAHLDYEEENISATLRTWTSWPGW
jgi:hemerythrin HHE cation binding domain-containing protein